MSDPDRWPEPDQIAKSVAPGLCIAKDGTFHFCAMEYLPALGLPVNEETVAWAQDLVKGLFREQAPQATIVDVFDQPPL